MPHFCTIIALILNDHLLIVILVQTVGYNDLVIRLDIFSGNPINSATNSLTLQVGSRGAKNANWAKYI